MLSIYTKGITSLKRNGFKNTGIKVLRIFFSRMAPSLKSAKLTGGCTARSEVFSIYSESVNSSYPHANALSIGRISDSLLRDMNDAIENGVISKRKLLELDSKDLDHLFLLTDCSNHSKETQQLLNLNLTVLDLHKFNSSHMLIGKLHSEIRSLFHAEVGSPFVFVNTRMWISHPMGDRFGPNAFHTDGFDAGHLKCMVYLTPMDIEHGYLEVKDAETRQVIGEPPGTAVLFQNSDLEHSGVPGTLFPRISIEVTLMRSHIDAPQAWAGHFYGRHFVDPTIFHHSNYVQPNGNRVEPVQTWQ